jgi:amino acid permease
MSWLVTLFASLGAAIILGALAFVSTLLGVVITSMIILMCGPLIDRLLARRNRRSA